MSAAGNSHRQKEVEEKVGKNKQTVRRRAWKLKENTVNARFQERELRSFFLTLISTIYGILLKMVF